MSGLRISDTLELPEDARLTPSQHTLQVRLAADARQARYGLFDTAAWEAEYRRRTPS